MSRIILYVSVATIAFIVGVAVNWSINSLGRLAIDKFYVNASIPSVLHAKPVDDVIWAREPIGCRRRKAAGG
jgi:hypothetical protein